MSFGEPLDIGAEDLDLVLGVALADEGDVEGLLRIARDVAVDHRDARRRGLPGDFDGGGIDGELERAEPRARHPGGR